MKPLAVDFEDIRGPLSVEIAAPVPPPCLAEKLEDILLDHGATPTGPLIDDLEDAAEDRGVQLAAEYVRHLLASLPRRGAATEALMRVVCGSSETVREAAAAVGTSHVAIVRQEAKIRAKLKKGLPSGATV